MVIAMVAEIIDDVHALMIHLIYHYLLFVDDRVELYVVMMMIPQAKMTLLLLLSLLLAVLLVQLRL
jgi:hypothetical protein